MSEQHFTTAFRDWLNKPVLREIRKVGNQIMASVAAELTAVAGELNDNLFPAISRLLAEAAQARADVAAANARVAVAEGRSAELEAEDVGESEAANAVVAATGTISGLFAANPDIPDVPPVDPVEPPVE